MAGIDLDLVKHALSVARERGFAEVEIEEGGTRFAASLDKSRPKSRPVVSDMSIPQDLVDEAQEIRATLVGYYHEASPALEVGRTIEKGEVVAVINALGLANDVESPYSGEVLEVLVQNGDPVEYGQALARLKVGV